MRTTKAYLAGLGTTGILIGSILVLLMLGSGFVAFDGLPEFGSAKDPVERVVVEPGALRGGKGRSRGRSEERAPRPAAAVRYRLPSSSLAAQGAPATARGHRASERRASGGRGPRPHGGAQVPAAHLPGGGATVSDGNAEGNGSRPVRRGRPSGGQPAPRSGGTSGGGTPGGLADLSGGAGGPGGRPPVAAPVNDPLGGIPEGRVDVLREGTGRGNGPRVLPPGLLP